MILWRVALANEQRGNSLWKSKEYMEREIEVKKWWTVFLSIMLLALFRLHVPISSLFILKGAGIWVIAFADGKPKLEKCDSKGHLGYEEKT